VFFRRLREPIKAGYWTRLERPRTPAETALHVSSVALFVAVLADRFGELRLGLIDRQHDWLGLLPGLWFLQTVARGWGRQPFDRTSVATGINAFLPYLAFGGRDPYAPPFPDRWWLGLAFFAAAFIAALILERRMEET